MSKYQHSFHALVTKGHIVKVLIDVLMSPISKGIFGLKKDGLTLRQFDVKETIMFDVKLASENLMRYHCSREIYISVNLKLMQKLLRNVKKKDSITLFIDKNQPEMLMITVKPEGPKKSARYETNGIVFQELTDYNEDCGIDKTAYEKPMVIESADFQKIKKLTNVGKIIQISIQKNNFLSFKSSSGNVYNSELGFGDLELCPNCAKCDCECEKTPKAKANKKSKSKSKSRSKKIYQEEENEEECLETKIKKRSPDANFDTHIYRADFYSNMLTHLVKLPGLCTQMAFYAPKKEYEDEYPLKIKVNMGHDGTMLGSIKIYVKDKCILEREEELRAENENILETNTKKTKARRKK